jgi:hypothetical protein
MSGRLYSLGKENRRGGSIGGGVSGLGDATEHFAGQSSVFLITSRPRKTK